jgi:hypothetical protein
MVEIKSLRQQEKLTSTAEMAGVTDKVTLTVICENCDISIMQSAGKNVPPNSSVENALGLEVPVLKILSAIGSNVPLVDKCVGATVDASSSSEYPKASPSMRMLAARPIKPTVIKRTMQTWWRFSCRPLSLKYLLMLCKLNVEIPK